jgi:hypothetical protein
LETSPKYSALFCAKIWVLRPIFKKLAYKDIAQYWLITRLLIGLKTLIRKLSARWVFWHDKQSHRRQNDCSIAITRFSMTFHNLQVLEIFGIVESAWDNSFPTHMNLSYKMSIFLALCYVIQNNCRCNSLKQPFLKKLCL